MRLQGVGWKPYGLPCACMDALEARRKNKRRSLQWITIAGTIAHGRFFMWDLARSLMGYNAPVWIPVRLGKREL